MDRVPIRLLRNYLLLDTATYGGHSKRTVIPIPPFVSSAGPKGMCIERWATRPHRNTLMPEMADAGQHHGKTRFIGSVNHLLIAHGAARLNNGRGPGLGGHQQTVSEREEGV